jgi:DNA-binding transcriptional regulator YiaG
VSAADIARVIGVSRMAVSDWERGVKVPTVEHALAYGKALAALERKAA